MDLILHDIWLFVFLGAAVVVLVITATVLEFPHLRRLRDPETGKPQGLLLALCWLAFLPTWVRIKWTFWRLR